MEGLQFLSQNYLVDRFCGRFLPLGGGCKVVRGYMDEIKEELISSVAEKVSELIAQNPALLHPRGSAALRALEGWARGPD